VSSKLSRGAPVDDLSQLPSQVHGVLDAEAETLSAGRVVNVRRVAGEQHSSGAVGRGLACHIGEPGDPGGVVDPEVAAVNGDQRLAQLAQGGLGAGSELALGHRDPHRPSIRVDHLAVADLVLQPADAVDAEGVAPDAQLRLLGHLDLGDQVAPRRIPPGELDAGCFTDEAAPSVTPDEILRPQELAAGQLDVDAAVVLREARHLTSVIDPHRQLGDPRGHDPLDLVLPDPERIRMTRGEVAHVQHRRPDHRGLSDMTLREEAIGDPTLIEHLDRARVKAAGPGAGEHMIGALLEDRYVDLRQRQLSRQHHPRRTASGDHHRMLTHGHTPVGYAGYAGGDPIADLVRADKRLRVASWPIRGRLPSESPGRLAAVAISADLISNGRSPG
jgi:hypothetical protein